MPQIDRETLGGGGGGGGGGEAGTIDKGRIANETLTDGDLNSKRPDPADNQPDFPAESFYLRKEDEVDWLDKNALFERKESTRRNSNSISHSNSTSSTTSQRFFLNLKSKASIIGLPKPQKFDCKVRRNCRPSRTRFFPKRSRSSGKTTVPPSEPSSPKVSCIGRVRSKKGSIIAKSRSLRLHKHQSPTEETITAATKPVKTGFWSNFKAVLRIGHHKDHAVDVKEGWTESPPRTKKNVTAAKHKGPSVNPVSEPPGLGGLKRFTSGRKSESWGGCDLDFDGVDEFESPDRGGSVFSRRGVSPHKEIDCTRDWESVGPASV